MYCQENEYQMYIVVFFPCFNKRIKKYLHKATAEKIFEIINTMDNNSDKFSSTTSTINYLKALVRFLLVYIVWMPSALLRPDLPAVYDCIMAKEDNKNIINIF